MNARGAGLVPAAAAILPPVAPGFIPARDAWSENIVNDRYILTPDQTRLYYQKIGDNPNIVVIPNGICLLEDFAPLARDRTLIVYDPRNRGMSDRTGEGDINLDVQDLDAVRQHFGIAKLDLIGHS
ncbi:MAG TPA: hypothetical protein VG297_11915 [Bryobacteraceae bacterium]|nr:hypothetical protein [Bryobacteraceae bacterium]